MRGREIDQKSNHNEINWDIRDELLMNKINVLNGDTEIEFTDKDVAFFEENWSNLPSTFSACVSFFEKDKIHLHSVSGATGTYLLGRFCHIDSNIESFVKEIARCDELDNDCIYAEIIHLPEKRTGNILYRPNLRTFEIPYLAKSNLPLQNQIHIDDIMISIKDDRIVLRSKAHNREIKPRMATAHNYSERNLPIYHFLCDIQYQNSRSSIAFDWGNLERLFNFFPRVTYNGVILSLKTWVLNYEVIEIICKSKEELKKWLNRNQLPRKVFLTEFDNTLPIDFEHDLSVEMFLLTIKNKEEVTLTEDIFSCENALINRDKNHSQMSLFSHFIKT